MKTYKDLGIYAMSFNYKQHQLYTDKGLKVYPPNSESGHSSTIDFYTPESYNDFQGQPDDADAATAPCR